MRAGRPGLQSGVVARLRLPLGVDGAMHALRGRWTMGLLAADAPAKKIDED